MPSAIGFVRNSSPEDEILSVWEGTFLGCAIKQEEKGYGKAIPVIIGEYFK